MEILAQALGSIWGIGAGISLTVAAVAAVGFRGRLRGLGAAVGTGLAVVFAGLALIAAPSEPPPRMGGQQQASPAASFEAPAAQDEQGEQLIAEAEQQLNRGDTGAAKATIARALQLFQERGDRVGQAHAYLGFARMAHFTGQSDEARENYELALTLFREAGESAEVARVLMAWGDLEQDVFQWDAAAQYYRQGRAVWASLTEDKSDPHVLLKLETAPTMPDGEEAAWEVLKQAKLIFENVGDMEAVDDVTFARGRLFQTIGELSNARGEFERAAAGYLRQGKYPLAATAALHVAEFDIGKGYNLSAVVMLDQAGTSFNETLDPVGQALVRLHRGNLARMLGEFAIAAAHFREAADTLRSLSHAEEVNVRLKLGQVLEVLGDTAGAVAAFERAVEAGTGTERRTEEAAAHLGLGRLRAAAGDRTAARQHWTRAAELALARDDRVIEARALLGWAKLVAADGDIDSAQDAVMRAEVRFREAEVPLGAVLAVLQRSRLLWSVGKNDTASNMARAALEEFTAVEEPVAEVNRFLGLPPVNHIDLSPAELPDNYNDGMGLAPGEAAAYEAKREANWAAYPDQNVEARQLLAEIEERLSDAESRPPSFPDRP